MSTEHAERELMRAHGAPLPTYEEALELAREEYGYRRSAVRGYALRYRGSDGGMHYGGEVRNRFEAEAWVNERVETLARSITSGEITGTLLFWNDSRQCWYLG